MSKSKKHPTALIRPLSAGIASLSVVALMVVIVVWVNRPKPPTQQPFADCVAKSLEISTHTTREQSVRFGAAIMEALSSKAGIDSEEKAEILRHVLASPEQASIIDSCAQLHGVNRAYNPMVRVHMKDSDTPIKDAKVSNGSDFEQCVTVENGKCRLLVVQRRGGQNYRIDVSCDGCRSEFNVTHKDFNVAHLASGDPLDIEVEIVRPLIEFTVLRSGKGVRDATLKPDFDGSFESGSCHGALRPPGDCTTEITDQTGVARFYFPNRRGALTLDVTIILPDGTQRTLKNISVAPKSNQIKLTLDPPVSPKAKKDVAPLPFVQPSGGAPSKSHSLNDGPRQ